MDQLKMIKFWWQSGYNQDSDPYRDTGETYLGGGMHCLSAYSFIIILSRGSMSK